jgi:hypothetical protein
MSDLAIMGVVLGGVLGTLTIIIFAIQEREASKRALELKMFQMENMRIVQQLAKTTEEISKTAAQRHDENMTYFQGMMQSMARIIRKQEEGEAPK